MSKLLLASRCCDECLTTPQRIVADRVAADIMRSCKEEHNHFICHKASLVGKVVHCRGVHDMYSSKAYAFAKAFGIPIVEIEPEDIK